MTTGTRSLIIAALFVLAAAGFLVSGFLHFSTYTGFQAVRRFGPCYFLHIIIFVPFLAMFFLFGKRGNKKGERKNGLSMEEIYPFGRSKWVDTVQGALFLYVIVNFALFLTLVEGMPKESASSSTGFELNSKGRQIRVIDEDEYHRQREFHLRGMSGHWMLFYFMPAASFGTYLARRKR